MVNLKYTKEQETEIKIYALIEGNSIKAHEEREDFVLKYMLKHNKTKASVIAKLSKLKIYVARPKLSKVTGDKAKTKEQMVTEMTTVLGFSTNELEGLDKTPKLVLVKLLKRNLELLDELKRLKPAT